MNRDVLNLLRYVTFRRVVNGILLLASYVFSRAFRKPVHWGMPAALSIEPTTSCNLRCPECPSGLRSFTRPTGMLDPTNFENLLTQISSTTGYLTFYFQGEPYLHPQFLDLVKQANGRRIYTATSTNAHYLNEETARKTVESGLDRLIVSIDGTTQETYSSYRVGGKLEKVIEGTRNVLRWKKELNSATPHVIFQFLVVKPNEHQIDEVKSLAHSLGVDEIRLKTAQIYDYANGSPLIPTDGRYSRYRQRSDGTWEVKSKLLNQCWKMWHSAVITWDGKVVPCCFDKDAHHALGNANETSFSEIWHGKQYESFRSALLQGRDQIEMCRNCTEGTTVWA